MKKILVVDDDAFTANVFRARLQREGYEVTLAATGEDAVSAMELQTPNLVLLDLILPGMSGMDVLEWIRRRPETQALPVVVFTNCYRPDVEEAAWKAGATNLQHKGTCPPHQMIEIVRGALSAAARPAEPSAPAAEDDSAWSAAALNTQFKAQVGGWLDQIRSAALQLTFAGESTGEGARGLHAMQQVLRRITGAAAVAARPATARLSSALDAYCAFLENAAAPLSPDHLNSLDSALDVVEARLTSPAAPAVSSGLPSGSPLVLVVDPDDVSRRLARTSLDRFGFSVVTVPDPAHARALCADNAFALMVLDAVLPAVAGLDLFQNLNALSAPAAAPGLFVTDLAPDHPTVEAIVKAGHGVIFKPYPPVELGLKACMAMP